MHTHLIFGVHNAIRDGFAHALAPALSIAGYVLPYTTVDMEPTYASLRTLTLAPSTSPLTHIQHHHRCGARVGGAKTRK
jgi:hypothetical protein